MSRNLQNAIQSIRQNKLRSVLAGFGIAWGLFLLIIFLGVGNGFKNGVMDMFNGYARKSLFVYGGQTSMATKSLNEYTDIRFRQPLERDLQARYGVIEACSPEASLLSMPVSAEGGSSIATVKGVTSDYFRIKILDVRDGRTLDRLDDYYGRHVAVIGEGVGQTLFGKGTGLGKRVKVGDALFEVVGILSSEDLFSMQERNTVYLPFSSFVSCFNTDGTFSSFCASLSAKAETSEIEKDMQGYLARRYGFDPHDANALYIADIETQTASFESLFHGLGLLVWMIGVCLLLSGIVGVCNVMLIIVKERTNEIGIRKAVGATPGAIISMIMTESVIVTVCAGGVGIVLGVGAVFLADKVLLPLFKTDLMSRLEINGTVVIAALVLLCLCGILAGLFPALKASQITPVDAIRYANRE